MNGPNEFDLHAGRGSIKSLLSSALGALLQNSELSLK